MAGFRQPGGQRELITVTADTTLTAQDQGKIICNKGASGSVTITLPDATTCQDGAEIKCLSCANQTFAVTAASGKLITFNNAAATSVTLSTSSEKCGGGFVFTAMAGFWHCSMLLEETQTVTVA